MEEKNNSIHIVFEDLFKLILELISDDLKIQKHFYNLNLSGLDTTPLQLHLHDGIFQLAGFKKNDISDEVIQWYFTQTERVLEIKSDEKAFQNLASDILEGLVQKRNKMYRKLIRQGD